MIKDQFLNSHDLLAVAELLQLAKQWLDQVDEIFSLGPFQLTKNFL